MKNFYLISTLIFTIIFQFSTAQNNVGIGTTSPNPFAVLDVEGDDKGILVPRLTNAQRTILGNTMDSTEEGLFIYDTDDGVFYYWDANTWISYPQIEGEISSFNYNEATGDLTLIEDGISWTVNIPTGQQGPAGEDGNDGADGIQGPQGIPGEDGNDGDPATDTDDQTLSYNTSNGELIIADGNTVSIPSYGGNVQQVSLNVGTQNINSTTLVDITDASITFTPRHSTVYVSFAVSGYNPLPNGVQSSWFSVSVVADGVEVGSFLSLSSTNDGENNATGAATVSAPNYPIQVTPGVPVTIKLQGRDGGVSHSGGFTIDKNNYSTYMTIWD